MPVRVVCTQVSPSNLVLSEGCGGGAHPGSDPSGSTTVGLLGPLATSGPLGLQRPREGEPLQPLWAQAGVSQPPKPKRNREACEGLLQPVLRGHWEGGSLALTSWTSRGPGGGRDLSPPPLWAFLHHDGMRLDMATPGHLQPERTAPSQWQGLTQQVGPSRGGHGGGPQGLGGHMASLLPGEPLPVRSRGTAVPTCLAAASSCCSTRPGPQSRRSRPASSLPGLGPCSGSPLGQDGFF